MKRVVVTGMGGVTAFGQQWAEIEPRLRAERNAVRRMDEWSRYTDLHTKLAAPIVNFKLPERYPRKKVRSMGRVAGLSVVATELALEQAGLLHDNVLSQGNVGVAYGSSSGSTDPFRAFGAMLSDYTTRGVTANSYIQMMGHTTAVNIALFFEVRGRIYTTSSACTSGSQGIGYAYEAIKNGYQTIMIAGGAEELCPTEAAVFDTLYATSVKNDTPDATPRPFDRNRDGLVIGEGATTLILEDADHARARGAKPIAEIVGFGTNCDAAHVTQPTSETMAQAMVLALQSANLPASAIGYISAHGTATERGDVAESHATAQVMGGLTPISSLKGYFGHTLGSCGAMEAWLTLEMARTAWFAPNINLSQVDPACADLDYVMSGGRCLKPEYVMSNNFAFGGINTSLIFRLCDG
jgi:3-oxoacyl-[acyl-carrier-protein] synthase II